jgi:uncharacterized protein YndB with AHSA1/START domain
MTEFVGSTRLIVVERVMPHPPENIWRALTQAPDGLKMIVTWTLTPSGNGTHVRMEQSGFRPQDEAGYRGMGGGWPRIPGRLEEAAARA